MEKIRRTRIKENFLQEIEKQERRLSALRFSLLSGIGRLLDTDTSDISGPIEIKDIPFLAERFGNLLFFNRAEDGSVSVLSEGDSEAMAIDLFPVDILLKLYSSLAFKLFLKGLNYPDCCVAAFNGSGTRSTVANWGGFIPCRDHEGLDHAQIVELLGRDPVEDAHSRATLWGVEYSDGSMVTIEEDTEPKVAHEEVIDGFELFVLDNLDGTFQWEVFPPGYDCWDDCPVGFEFFMLDDAIEDGREFIREQIAGNDDE